MRYVETSSCEVCGGSDLRHVLNLGSHPLCDDLPDVGYDQSIQTHPQEILLCPVCLTGLQRFQVPKEVLFPSTYHYRSGLTGDVLRGMQDLVAGTLQLKPATPGAVVLDIGCNDGSLLGMFKERGLTTVGVDPTDAILESGDRVDHSYQSYFDDSTADEIAEGLGAPDYIVMTNVFAHIEDLPRLCSNLRRLIGPNTLLVIENHYLGSITEGYQFDTFYHEHPRTYSARSFGYVAESLGCGIESISFPRRYGGNIRVAMSPKALGASVALPDEANLAQELADLQGFFESWRSESRKTIEKLTVNGPFIGKALPGRAVMLINSLGITAEQMPVIYEKPGSPKIGHWVPNTQIEIVSDDMLAGTSSSDLVIWAWHIVDEVLPYLAASGYQGRVWVPLPKFELVAELT